MFDVKQEIYDEDGERDEHNAMAYIEGLVEAFDASPEAAALPEAESTGWVGLMLEYGINYPGVTPPETSLSDFKEVLFDLFPRKVSTEAENAPEIVAELRAFWAFVQRQYGLSNAKPILAELDKKDTVVRLRQKLSDPSNYGMAKSFFALGQQAGYDMTTKAGIDQFMLAYNANLLANRMAELPPMPPRLDDLLGPPPGLPADRPRGKALEDKRKKRKQQRQARKRNRK